MNINNDKIYELIAKSFTGELTEQEFIQLEEWKKADRLNLLEYNDFEEIWKASNRLAMPSKIDLLKSLTTTHKKAGIRKGQIKWLAMSAQIAAILVLAVIFSGLYNLFLAPKPQNPQIIDTSVVYQEVKATYGTQSRVELADGTVVYLNSGSKLRFPNSFNGMKFRNVELSGEGHFTVAKNSEHPFVVDVKKMQIQVLGTTFNVDAYPENDEITVALVEGKITLKKETANGVTDLMGMKPNQVAYYRQKDNKVLWENVEDLNKFTAWTTGKIVFSDDPVRTVIQKLENWYNVDIELADKRLEHYRFTGTFIDEPLEQVLSILNRTSKMEYQIISAQKMEDNSYSKRRIILKSK
jgi:transmembrane sensor